MSASGKLFFWKGEEGDFQANDAQKISSRVFRPFRLSKGLSFSPQDSARGEGLDSLAGLSESSGTRKDGEWIFMPKVSVLMPVYNTKEQHLREAIDSVLGQTFGDFEFLILNDGSTDENVRKTVLSYCDPRIVYVENETNLGISGSRNKLVDMAKGDYLAVVDHDDISMPDRFEKQVRYLDEHPDFGVVAGLYEKYPTGGIMAVPAENEEIQATLLTRCAIYHQASMIRKSVLIENDVRYEEKYTPAEDYALWCRLLRKTKFYNIQDTLLKYRIHDENTSLVQKKRVNQLHIIISHMARKQVDSFYESDGFYESLPHESVYRVKLFSLIPILRVNFDSINNVSKIFLFNVIPLFSIKKKNIINH